MRVVLALRSVLGRWQLVGLVPMVIYVVVLGGPKVATGIAVWLVGIVGWIAGILARDLGNWPLRTLVPGYPKTLFHTVLVVLVLVPLGCGILWTMAGNPLPPFGPGLLWGTTMALCVVRFRSSAAELSTTLVGIIGLGFYLVWAAKQAMHPEVFELLTDLRLQLPALALATSALFYIRWMLNARFPVTAPDHAVEREPLLSNLVGLMAGPPAGLRREVVASLPLVVLALLLALVVRAGITTYPMSAGFMTACLLYALLRVLGRLANIHVPLRSFWLSGQVETRRSLGRKCALPILLRGLGWLPAGIVGAAILAIGTPQTAQFDGVFLIALTILLAITLSFGTVRRIPAPTMGWWQFIVVGMLSGSLTTPLFLGFELGWADRCAAVLGLAGLAVATWFVVARALARAEIVQ